MDETAIHLRPISEDDFWLFQRQAVDPDAIGEFNWSGFKSLARFRQQYEKDGMLGDDGGRLIIMCDDAVVGNLLWGRTTYGMPDWWCWNIGITVLPEFRNQGIGTTAQRLLVRHLFETTVAERIEAYTDIDNIAEQRALEKVGFTKDGLIRCAQFRRGQWRDLYLYSILRFELKG